MAKPEGSDNWSAIEWAAYSQPPEVLCLLIANSSPTPAIKKALKSALELVSERARRVGDKSKGRDPKETDQPTAQTTRSPKDPEINYQRTIKDIIQDPPFSQTHKDSSTDGPTKPNDEQLKVLAKFEAVIVQFYKDKGESGTFRRHRPLENVIYGDGPEGTMKNTRSDLKKILGELPDSLTYLNDEPKFTWVHLPATNVSAGLYMS